jgi:hypothetical protein
MSPAQTLSAPRGIVAILPAVACAVMRRDVSQRTAPHQTGFVLNIHEGSKP